MDVPVDPWTAEDAAFTDPRMSAQVSRKSPAVAPPAQRVVEYDNPYPVGVRVLLAFGLGILGWGVIVGLGKLLALIA